MRKINLIVIHCSDTYARMDIGVNEIRQWHLQRGFNDIGYHYVIRRDGAIEQGRPIEKPGAHAAGYNTNSIGICYAGGKGDNNQPEDNRTPEQKQAMYDLVASLKQQFPQAEITGHRDLPGVHKDCPCFSVKNDFKKLENDSSWTGNFNNLFYPGVYGKIYPDGSFCIYLRRFFRSLQ